MSNPTDVPQEDWITVVSDWNNVFANHEDWSTWRSYKDGALSHARFYHGADKSRNQYVHATVNVMKVDETIPYPHDAMADGIWIHVFGLVK